MDARLSILEGTLAPFVAGAISDARGDVDAFVKRAVEPFLAAMVLAQIAFPDHDATKPHEDASESWRKLRGALRRGTLPEDVRIPSLATLPRPMRAALLFEASRRFDATIRRLNVPALRLMAVLVSSTLQTAINATVFTNRLFYLQADTETLERDAVTVSNDVLRLNRFAPVSMRGVNNSFASTDAVADFTASLAVYLKRSDLPSIATPAAIMGHIPEASDASATRPEDVERAFDRADRDRDHFRYLVVPSIDALANIAFPTVPTRRKRNASALALLRDLQYRRIYPASDDLWFERSTASPFVSWSALVLPDNEGRAARVRGFWVDPEAGVMRPVTERPYEAHWTSADKGKIVKGIKL